MRKKSTAVTALTLALTVFGAAFSVPVSAMSVSAESAIVVETSTGRTVFEKDADTRRPMASTTKIMTALIALEAGDTARQVSVSGEAVGVEGSSVYLKSGDSLTLDDLVWALMLESANDAAADIAIEVAGSVDAFAELMNAKAAELGLKDTHFTNPHGLDNENHYTTARDLARLAAYALKNERFREIVSTYRHNISVGGETRCLLNHNAFFKSFNIGFHAFNICCFRLQCNAFCIYKYFCIQIITQSFTICFVYDIRSQNCLTPWSALTCCFHN